MRKPDFLFVGPSKTASTWIYKVLKEHPDFDLPASKDIYFFDKYYSKGENWYASFFSSLDKLKLSGEFSHDYLYQDEALERIKDYNPNIKLIVCLRNPYDRTLSGINFLKRNGFGENSIKDYVTRHHELIDGSLYGKNLKKLFNLFSDQQVMILDFQKLEDDPYGFLDDLYDFFDVTTYYPKWLLDKVNSAQKARNEWLAYVVKKIAIYIRGLGFSSLVTRLKTNPFINCLIFKKGTAVSNLSDEEKKYLSQYFDADIDQLSKLLHKDFSDWKYGND